VIWTRDFDGPGRGIRAADGLTRASALGDGTRAPTGTARRRACRDGVAGKPRTRRAAILSTLPPSTGENGHSASGIARPAPARCRSAGRTGTRRTAGPRPSFAYGHSGTRDRASGARAPYDGSAYGRSLGFSVRTGRPRDL